MGKDKVKSETNKQSPLVDNKDYKSAYFIKTNDKVSDYEIKKSTDVIIYVYP